VKPLRLVVLISGRGSNLQAIINAKDPLVHIVAVISDKPSAKGSLIAQQAGIVTEVIDPSLWSDRASYDSALRERIDSYQPELIALAGFMRILTPEFVNHYQGRLINIHPSLLPNFKGLHTHERALKAGVKEHGASVHFVTEELDSGPVILQARVPVYPEDTPERLADRVLRQEHRIYSQVIHWFAEERLKLQGQYVLLDGQPITFP
jgi:phosphoribosylglycinamide formyltransferase-1